MKNKFTLEILLLLTFLSTQAYANNYHSWFPQIKKKVKEKNKDIVLLKSDEAEIIDEKITERSKRIEHIAAEIQSVNYLFVEMSQLTSEQGEQIDAISENIDHALDNTKKGFKKIKRANAYQAWSIFSFFGF